MKMNKKRSYILTAAGIFAMFAMLFTAAACKKNKVEEVKEDIIPVTTAAVTVKDIAVPVHTSGRLYPKTMVKLSFKVGGIIARLNADEGVSVKKGQVLAALDLAEIKARYNQAKNGFAKAERDLKRVENLYKDRAATLEQKQDMQTAFEVAKSNLQIAKFNFDHAVIKAPANGKILKRLAEQGEMVGVGTPLFVFGSTQGQWVIKAGVSARDMVRIKLNDTAVVRFDAYPERTFHAVVTEISTAIDPASGTYEIELAVEAEGVTFAAGFVGKVAVEPSAREQYHVIPVDSIVEGEGYDGVVFTVKDKKAVKLNIKVAHIFPKTAAVRSGLENVKTVVTSGAAYLRDGSLVDVTK